MDTLAIKEVSYSYIDGSQKRVILQDINMQFEEGRFYTILGASGSGKTTLLSLLAGLEKTQAGQISYKGEDIRERGLEQYRRKDVAIVFQQYNLISYLTAYENVELAMNKANVQVKNKKQVGYAVLEQFGIVKSKADRNVNKLSGGEQQRVAIARAVASNAEVIFADEPTGNLDSETEKEIIKLFAKLAHEYGKTIIVVTHSKEVSSQSDIRLYLKEGKLYKIKSE